MRQNKRRNFACVIIRVVSSNTKHYRLGRFMKESVPKNQTIHNILKIQSFFSERKFPISLSNIDCLVLSDIYLFPTGNDPVILGSIKHTSSRTVGFYRLCSCILLVDDLGPTLA